MADEVQPHPSHGEVLAWLEDLRAVRPWKQPVLTKNFERLMVAYLNALSVIYVHTDKFDAFCPPEEVAVLRGRIALLTGERLKALEAARDERLEEREFVARAAQRYPGMRLSGFIHMRDTLRAKFKEESHD